MSESPLLRMANVKGEITPLEAARISILDRGFLYGDSVYEVFRTYDGVPLFCHEAFRPDGEFGPVDPLENLAIARPDAGRDAANGGRGQRAEGDRHLRTVARDARHRSSRSRAIARFGEQLCDHLEGGAAGWKPEFYSRGMRLAVTCVRRNPVER